MGISPSNHSNRHFHKAQVQLQHLCHKTFEQPLQPAPAAREYILTIPETQMPSSWVIKPPQQSQAIGKGQKQQSIGHLTSFLVSDDQQAGPSRPLIFTFMPMKHFNYPTVASATGEECHITTYQDLQASSET